MASQEYNPVQVPFSTVSVNELLRLRQEMRNPRRVLLHESEVVATRREIEALRAVAAQAKALLDDPNACWEDLVAAVDALGMPDDDDDVESVEVRP